MVGQRTKIPTNSNKNSNVVTCSKKYIEFKFLNFLNKPILMQKNYHSANVQKRVNYSGDTWLVRQKIKW